MGVATGVAEELELADDTRRHLLSGLVCEGDGQNVAVGAFATESTVGAQAPGGVRPFFKQKELYIFAGEGESFARPGRSLGDGKHEGKFMKKSGKGKGRDGEVERGRGRLERDGQI